MKSASSRASFRTLADSRGRVGLSFVNSVSVTGGNSRCRPLDTVTPCLALSLINHVNPQIESLIMPFHSV
jgi:hypothetical protein